MEQGRTNFGAASDAEERWPRNDVTVSRSIAYLMVELFNAMNCAEALMTGTDDVEVHAAGIREVLDLHWAASNANDFNAEHEIYREDAVLEYPQSGERIRGRFNIQASRALQPNSKHFLVRRIVGAGDLWVSELVITYDGRPSFSVSVMEFRDGKVASETQYFADFFEPGPSRAHLVEHIE